VTRFIVLIAVATALGGCTAPRPLWQPATSQQLEPPICASSPACISMWQYAQVWVNQNSNWKIRVVSDTVIETFGPDNSTDVAYAITKEPLGDNRYQIVMRARCGSVSGCSPRSPTAQIIDFNRALRSIAD
jgi:hypothetical protein